ncbi:hypothetical protein [Sporosalibacterium faouarense]|uniref:hypothetical protein n=1 Tax=Sporosalibacterium faouarense TaxID=516123 RepID=UPI00141CBAFE|nr:hypothetical protein [Sporosalibacterium faouarense]MTI46898.1 hypothetical protein [Bacillota bacterium]MTI49894.1 hypothetical protein [Bacillota bacterium]
MKKKDIDKTDNGSINKPKRPIADPQQPRMPQVPQRPMQPYQPYNMPSGWYPPGTAYNPIGVPPWANQPGQMPTTPMQPGQMPTSPAQPRTPSVPGQPETPAAPGQIPVVDMPRQPGAPVMVDPNYLQGYLIKNIGRYVRIDFLIGTNTLIDRAGELLDVGIDFVVLRETETDDHDVCDLYSIKFVKIFY